METVLFFCMAKILGTLFGLSLASFLAVIAWRVYPEEILELLPTSIRASLQTEAEKENIHIPDVSEENIATQEELSSEMDQEEREDFDTLMSRGNGYLSEGYLSLAIKDFERASEIKTDSKEAIQKLITAEMALRNYDAAKESAEKAHQAFSDDISFSILLGEIEIQRSAFGDAKKIFENLPDSPERKYYLGIMSSYFGEYDTAKELLSSVSENAEYGERSRIMLGAFQEFSLFPQGNPLHLELLLAKSFNSLGFYEMSIQMCKKILKERDDYRDAWIILGHSYLSLEKYSLARDVLTKALDLDPTKPETAFFLGIAENNLEQYEEAITHLSMARQNGYAPQNEVTLLLAEAYVGGKYYEAAQEEYGKLLEIRNAPLEYYSASAQLALEKLNDPNSALSIARNAVEAYPNSEEAQALVGESLLAKGSLEEAEQIFQEMSEKNPENPITFLFLGKIAEQQENWETALEEYKKAYDIAPYSNTGSEAAQSYNAIITSGKKNET